MKLSELKDDQLDEKVAGSSTEFGPTKKFHKFYGNYCGPGNCGGDPTDEVDAACMRHDVCYHKNGKWNVECDKEFIKDLTQLEASGKLTFKQKTAVKMMKAYFNKAIAKADKKAREAEAAAQRNKDAFGMNY